MFPSYVLNHSESIVIHIEKLLKKTHNFLTVSAKNRGFRTGGEGGSESYGLGTATTVPRPETRDPRYRNDRFEARNERARVPQRGAGLIMVRTHSRLAEARDWAPVPGVSRHIRNY